MAESTTQNPSFSPTHIDFQKWQERNLEKSERKNLTKKAIAELRAVFEAEQSIQKADLDQVTKLADQLNNKDSLKDSKEREKFMASVEMRLTVLLVLLINSGELAYSFIKQHGIQHALSKLLDRSNSIRITQGGKKRPLTPQEIKILEIGLKIPASSIKEVRTEWSALSDELFQNIQSMDYASQLTMAAIRGEKAQKPKNLDKDSETTWNDVVDSFKQQSTTTQLVMAGAGALAVGGLFYWIGKKFFGKPKSTENNNSKDPKNKKKEAPQVIIAKTQESIGDSIWKWTKRTALVAGGAMLAGSILGTDTVEKFFKERTGKSIKKSRFQSLVYLSEFKFLEFALALAYGPDQKEDFHKRVSKKLDIGDKSILLWCLGNMKYRQFNKATKRSKAVMALGLVGSSLSYIPFIGSKLNNSTRLSEEAQLRKTIRAELKRLKITPPRNATVDEVLKLIDEKAETAGELDKRFNTYLSPKEQKTYKKNKVKEDNKLRRTLLVASSVERTSIIRQPEQEALLTSTKELLSDTQRLEKSIPSYWEKFKKSIANMGFSLGQLAPDIKNKKEEADYEAARKLFLTKMAAIGKKSDEHVFSTIRTDLLLFQQILTRINPNTKIPPHTLRQFKKIKEKIFGKNGYHSLIKGALLRANNETALQYRAKPKDVDITLEKLKAVAVNGLFGTLTFLAGFNSRGQFEGKIHQYILLCGNTVLATTSLAMGLSAVINPGYHYKSEFSPSGEETRVPYKNKRAPEIFRRAGLPYKGIWWVIKKTAKGTYELIPFVKKGKNSSASIADTQNLPGTPSPSTPVLRADQIKLTRTGAWYKYNNGNFHITTRELAKYGTPERACQMKLMKSLQISRVRVRAGITQYKINGRWINSPENMSTPKGLTKARGLYLKELKRLGIDYSGQQIGATGMLKYFEYLKRVAGPAFAASIIYHLEVAENKKQALAQTAISLAAVWGGAKTTDMIIGKRLPLTPAGQACRAALSFAGGIAAAMGFTKPITEIIAPFIPQFKGDIHFYNKLTRTVTTATTFSLAKKASGALARKLITKSIEKGGTQVLSSLVKASTRTSLATMKKIAAKSLEKTGTKRLAEIIAGTYSKTIGRGIAKFAATSWMKKLSTSLGARGAILAATIADDATIIGVLDDFIAIGMGAWMTYDIYQLVQLTRRAVLVNREIEQRNKKPIKQIKFADYRSRKAIESQFRSTGNYPESMTLDQIINQSPTAEINAKLQKVGYAKVEIYRTDQSGFEQYVFARGQVMAVKVFDDNGKEIAAITEKDLNQSIHLPPPTKFTRININTTKLSPQKAESLYNIAIHALKSECGWTKLDFIIKNKDEIEIKRIGSKQTINIKHRNGSWSLEGSTHSGKLDFYQAIALANLRNRVKELIKENKYTPGSSKPFEVDNGSVDFDKSWSPVDVTILKKGKWMNFYQKTLGLSPTKICAVLNSLNW